MFGLFPREGRISRHERDQSFLVPVPVRKKFGPGHGPGPGEKKNSGLGPGPGEKKFSVPITVPTKKSLRSWSRSRQKQILGEGSSQKYFRYSLGPKKTFWSWSCSEKILVLVLVKKNFGPGPGQKKKFGPGPGGTGTWTTLLISTYQRL
jgi:hypothetical protein